MRGASPRTHLGVHRSLPAAGVHTSRCRREPLLLRDSHDDIRKRHVAGGISTCTIHHEISTLKDPERLESCRSHRARLMYFAKGRGRTKSAELLRDNRLVRVLCTPYQDSMDLARRGGRSALHPDVCRQLKNRSTGDIDRTTRRGLRLHVVDR